MSDEKEVQDGALAEPAAPVVADYTDNLDREEAHEQAREEVKPEPKAQKKPKPRDDDDARFRGILNETLSEREKRQAAERERDQLRTALAEHQRRIQAEQERDPPPDMFKDPAAYNAWMERQLDRRAQAVAARHVSPLQERLADASLRVSEMQARAALGEKRWNGLNDWIEKQDQRFKDWAMSQPDPYAAAYSEYRRVTTFERLGSDDLETYEEKLRAQIKAEMEAERQRAVQTFDEPEADEDAPPVRKPMPHSFAAKPSAGERTSSGAGGVKPLGQILKEKPTRQDKRR